MSWPVQIIPPGDNVPKIKWRKWFFCFLFIVFIFVAGWVGVTGYLPAEDRGFLKLWNKLFVLWLFTFFILLSLRVYYYGVCLSALEASEHAAALTKREWTQWANQKIVLSASNLFLPSVISQKDIATSHFVKIFDEQHLKLRGHLGEAYTAEQIIYELLASIRAKVIELAKTCVFDVIFTNSATDLDFSEFKGCWSAIGFPDTCLNKYYYCGDTLEKRFDTLSNIENNRVSIIISLNVENAEGYTPGSTEFASILLITHSEQSHEKENNGVALRTMTCGKNSLKQDVVCMMTYQPDVLKTSKVLFSNMSVDDALDISEILRKSCLSINTEWDYESQHLNLMLGKLGDAHFWLVFALAFFISAENEKPVLMVARVGDEYVFNVIKSFDNSREH